MSHGVAGSGLLHSHGSILEQFKKNDEVFRNTMEAIFQKYSKLGDSGPDVCFKTMTFRTRKGVVPIQSAEAEQELQHLRNYAGQSLQVWDNPKDKQFEATQRTENDLDSSLETENSDVSLWHSTETSQLSANSTNGSRSVLWDLSQPEDEDEDLERTLRSHNKTLLDIYPSMLNQIGEVYRRQHVTKAASAVLQRYRRQRCKSSQGQRHNRVLSNSFNHTLNKTMEKSVSVQKPHNEITCYYKDRFSYEDPPIGRSIQESSPMKINKNSSLGNQELSPLMTKGTLSLASIRSNQELSSLKAIQNSFTASNSKHQELSPLVTKRNVSLASIRSSQELSPLKTIRNASLASIRSSQELSPLKAIRNASLATSSSSSSNLALSPLKAIRNASIATSSSNLPLSPLKAIRISSLATSSNNRAPSPLKAVLNSSLSSIISNQELSPLKAIQSSPHASSACFYSPRRADCENRSVAENLSHWTSPGLHMNSKPRHQPVRVLDLSTTPPASTQLDVMQESNVLPSTVWSISQSMCNSPLKGAASVSLTGQGGKSVIPSPSKFCNSQLGPQFSGAVVERECFRERLYSPAPSPRKALTGNPSSDGRSPHKQKDFSLEEEQQTSSIYYPKPAVPVNRTANTQIYRSYRSEQEVSSSPYHSPCVFSDHQENLAVPKVPQHRTKQIKRQQSFSDHPSTSSSIPHMSSMQIDAEFRRLYHHFICLGNSSSCLTSSCHLCERQSQKGDQTPPSIFPNVSALALTPVGSQLRKRRRQSEVEESLRMKRFRESCSPKQQYTRYTSSAVTNTSEENRTWNRALLLQCPSPGFLRASGCTRKRSRSQTSLQNYSPSPSWRDTSGSVGAAEASSPVRAWNQNGVSLTPSGSRRRLLYGPLQ